MLAIRAARLCAVRDAMPIARAVIVPLAAVDAPDTPQHAPVRIHVRLSGQCRCVEVEQQAVVEEEFHGG